MTDISEIANEYGITTTQLEKAFYALYDMLFAYDPKEVQAVGALIERGITPQRVKGAAQ